MIDHIKLCEYNSLPKTAKLKLAVVGHVEWVSFLRVNQLPKAGWISHSNESIEFPAGGAAVTAVQMAKSNNQEVHLFTALGADTEGKASYEILSEMGLIVHAAWRNKPTRKGISMVDKNGERAITVIGERLQPLSKDALPWEDLKNFDGVFITATDELGIKLCRKSKKVLITPRLGKEVIKKSGIKIDVLVGSGLDPDERMVLKELKHQSSLTISTEGEAGGEVFPGGRFESFKVKSKVIDTYGCGDSFAAGLTTGIAANWELDKAISLGAYLGANCSTFFGPYADMKKAKVSHHKNNEKVNSIKYK